MTLLLLILIQAERRISPVVIVGATLVFITGVSLLVYFYRRYKRIEKEAEDDWDSSRHSLFVNVRPPAANAEMTNAAPSEAETEAEKEQQEIPVNAGGTRELAADLSLASFSPVTAAEADPKLSSTVEESIDTPAVEVTPARPTEILASPVQVEPVVKSEPTPALGEVSTRSDFYEHRDKAAEAKPSIPQPPIVAQQPQTSARVESPTPREPFEPPRIERISQREPYEPPTIQPLTPREAAATRELRSPQVPRVDSPVPIPKRESIPQGTMRLASTPSAGPGSLDMPPVWGETSKLADHALAGKSLVNEPSIPAVGTRTHRTGSVLGLPAESSRQPLIFGEPGRATEEVGIGALTNYGRDTGPKGGRSGSIALLAVVLLIGGALALYLFVPSVHSRVGAFVAHIRGTDTQAAIEAAMKPRAQVIPSTRPEVNKNMVTARGAVDNISDEPLENLTVEVSLQRGGGAAPEVRTVAVTPNPLPARERGTFEFEYDGKRDTGFLGYTITRLFSNGTEVRFRAPGQK